MNGYNNFQLNLANGNYVKIDYSSTKKISAEQFVDILNRSTLAERRPVSDLDCIRGMLENADLLITAWDRDKSNLVGVSRSVTDFNYACYLSDLAVDKNYQRMGIGTTLIDKTQLELGPKCKLILLSAPAAAEYYPGVGFSKHESAWVLGRDQSVMGSSS